LAELEAMEATARQAREAWPLPDVPVVLLSGLRAAKADRVEVRRMEEAARREALAQVETWLRQVPGAEHVNTRKRGNNIHVEAADLVVNDIRRVIAQATVGTPRNTARSSPGEKRLGQNVPAGLRLP